MRAAFIESLNRLRAGFFSPAKFELIVFFYGPLSRFGSRFGLRAHPREIIFRKSYRYRFLAKAMGQALTRRFENIVFEVRE